MENVLIVMRLKAQKNFQKLGEPIDRKAWTYIVPTDVNAYYRPSFNDISNPPISLDSERNRRMYSPLFSFYSRHFTITFLQQGRTEVGKSYHI